MKSFNLTLCALLAMVVALPAMAAPTGTIYANGGKASGTLRWMNSAKKYTITNAKGMTTEYKEDDVENVDVDRPKELDAAIKQVKAGSAASAVANLEKIAKEYAHLTYDREATEWLAKAYLAQGNAAKAVAACEAIIRNDDEAAYMGPMAVAYWKALTKDGKASKLGLLLDKAIASGDAAAAAAALAAAASLVMDLVIRPFRRPWLLAVFRPRGVACSLSSVSSAVPSVLSFSLVFSLETVAKEHFV